MSLPSYLVVLNQPFVRFASINGMVSPGYHAAVQIGPVQIEMNEQAVRDTIRMLQDWLDDRKRLAPLNYNSSFPGTHRTNGEALLPLDEENKLRADVAEAQKEVDA